MWSLAYIIQWQLFKAFPTLGTGSYEMQVAITILTRGICLFLMLPALAELAGRRYNSRTLFIISALSIFVFSITAVLSRAAYNMFDGLIVYNSFSILLAAGALGVWLSTEIQKAGHLLPLCLIAAGVDIISVARGPTGELVKQIERHTQYVMAGIPHHPPWASYLLLHYPQPGVGLELMIGAGDLAFFGLLTGAVIKFGFNKINILLVALWGFIAVVASIILQSGIPALPFIGFGFIISNVRMWKLEKMEWIITGVFVISLLIVGLLFKMGVF